MSERRRTVDRRRFITGSLETVAAATVLGRAAAGAGATSVAEGLPARAFGRTALELPILGCGGAAMSEQGAAVLNVPSLAFDVKVALIRHAFDAGIRYFDTARIYGDSESVYGHALAGVRDQVFLATKVHASEPAEVRKSVETSLAELATDHIDCIQIHSQRLELDQAMKVRAELEKLKAEGMVRFIGLTGHDRFDRMFAKIDTGAFDQVLVAYGYFRKGMGNILTHEDLEWRELCLARAHELGMGIVAMKVMGAWVLGHASEKVVPGYDPEALGRLPGAAIRWVLQDQRVQLMIIGVSTPADVDSNITTLRGDPAFTSADRTVLASFCTRAYDSEFLKGIEQRLAARAAAAG